MNIMAVGKNITWKKRSNIIFSISLRLLGKISSREEDENFGEDFKNGGGEEYQVAGNFILS